MHKNYETKALLRFGLVLLLTIIGYSSIGQSLVINEIMADPPSNNGNEMPGDTNGDGTRSASEDEFIEFVNISQNALDISGWQLLDTNSVVTLRHVFPSNTVVPAGAALVLFGGGKPTGDFGGSIVQTASTGSLNITNSNEELRLVDLNNDTVLVAGIGNTVTQMSWSREPELTGEFAGHAEVLTSEGLLFSPGTKADGTPFSFGKLLINEIHADPASGIAGDANGDGARSASEDEFIEFLNIGNSPLDVSGWQVLDTNSQVLVRHIFPANSVIPTGGAMVLFGGGTPSGDFGGSLVQVASSGTLGISNTNEQLLVVNALEDTIIVVGFADFNDDASFNRNPDLSGDFSIHSGLSEANGALFSPGTRPDGTPYNFGKLIINEIHADPASDLTGDANGDGTRSASEDEFIEFANTGNYPLDISGWQVLDTNSQVLVRHIFPAHTIVPSGGMIVLFGGGTPTGDFGGSIVQIASTGALGISNTNEELRIVNRLLDTVIIHGVADYNNDQSWTRDPDFTGDFVAHSTAAGSGGALFSPGTKIDGTAGNFGKLVINEIHADPAADLAGDANGDGTRSASDDEFIEFVNAGNSSLDISGWQVLDTNSQVLQRHVFPANTILEPGGAIVVFGGGVPTGDFGLGLVQTATSGALGISNSNEELRVVNATMDTVLVHGFLDYNNNQSWSRDPDVSGDFVAHSTATGTNGALYSPGKKLDGTSFGTKPPSTLIINEVHADPAGDATGDANGDGTRSASEDEFIEFVNSGVSNLDVSGWQVLDTNSQVLVRHIFPDNSIIPAGGALVVFGGGAPTGTFGSSIVQTASSGSLGITNSNEELRIVDSNQDTVVIFSIPDFNNDQSWTLDPDITGTNMVAHSTANGANGALFSPGLKVDGSFFIVPEATVVSFASSTLVAREGDDPVSIDIIITTPSSSDATTVDIELVKGSATDIESFATQTLTFPAGSATTQSITITITDDADVEPTDTLQFELKNLAGGVNAELGANTIYELIIQDNDLAASSLEINEYMAWPAGADASADGRPTVDSNGDGSADFEEDEFIEFVNAGSTDLDISGWKVYDQVTSFDPLRHVFPAGTVLNAGGAIVVFGGGNPQGDFGGSQVQLASQASQGLGLTNSGDVIIIRNTSGETVLEFPYGGQVRAQSITRIPDVTGPYSPHPTLGDREISPGTKVDGTPFAIATATEVKFASSSGGVGENTTNALTIELEIVRPDDTNATTADVIISTVGYESDITFSIQTITFPAGSDANQSVTVSVINDEEAEGDELFIMEIINVTGGNLAKTGIPATFELIVVDDDVPLAFNEIHADPAGGAAGDANGDGITDDSTDEFIEIVNISETTIDMSGWEFHDGTQVRHIFDFGTRLEPGKALVVFSGGIPVGSFGGSQIQLSSEGGLDLDDNGETITIFTSSSTIAAKTEYGTSAGDNQSISRDPDYTGGFVKHSTIANASGALYSPGRKSDGTSFQSTVLNTLLVNRLSIYPNPVVDQVTIDAQKYTEDIRFVLFGLSGQKIVNYQIKAGTLKQYKLADFEGGMYIYELTVAKTGTLLEKGKLYIKD
ncbi:MAG: lamin tail domain-containing protein [Cyclobacteriaceae bacterium]